ncbi:hypothetical protein M514_12995 [Trichuris suis]|uniref:Uncharacterized protein n=1 Tax=Trichuris suis TaxID=68888 RepID=A0A085N4W5_9BILA|nr:hypothetical protein M514_12995 [Trichuris suis]
MKFNSCYHRSSIFKHILSVYGTPSLTEARLLETSSLKLDNTTSKLSFLLQCRDLNILPKAFLPTTGLDSNPRIIKLLRNTGFGLLRSQIREHRRTIASLKHDIGVREAALHDLLSDQDLRFLSHHVKISRNALRNDKDKVPNKKLNHLILGKPWESTRSKTPNNNHVIHDLDRIVINLSSRSLNTMEKLVLAKGLNYIPTPKKASFADLIARVEQSLINVEPNEANQIRGAISNTLTRTKHTPKKNLSLMEVKILKDLKKDNNTIITRADKGNAVVILNREMSINNVKQLLDTASYKPIQVDPTDNVRKKLKTKLTRYAEETKEEQLVNFTKLLKYSLEDDNDGRSVNSMDAASQGTVVPDADVLDASRNMTPHPDAEEVTGRRLGHLKVLGTRTEDTPDQWIDEYVTGRAVPNVGCTNSCRLSTV